MPLVAGQTLAHYEILGPLGAGGMGEVWRARDTRLDREVAIKVLPEHFADDEERLRRFEREARTLASLNHPNVAGIHGIDQVGDTCFLAMELVPGEDLAAKLARGPLPIDEAVDVCRQIAEGLEAAHEAGVVHRDLKPANVRVTPDGVVKVLDFGLAKPVGPRATQGASTTESDSVLATEEGLVLGTPTYMSPEQARGKPVDKRTDVWAFGCVLYECLTGKRAFGGDSLTDVLASIVEREPSYDALPDGTPRAVRWILERCLAKDPRRRLRDVGEARIALAGDATALVRTGTAADVRTSSKLGTGLIVGLLLGAGVGYFATHGSEASSNSVPRVTRSLVAPPKDTAFQMFADFGGPPVLSLDGTKLAFVGISKNGESRIWVRELDDLDARPVPGSEGGYQPFWSPDGRSIGFFAQDALRRVDLDGSSPLRLADAGQGKGGTWASDGTIVFSPDFGSSLFRIPAAGGEVVPVTQLGEGETTHRWPSFLPDGRQVLYFAGTHADVEQGRKGIHVATLGEDDGELLVESDANGIYCDGTLLYVAGGVLHTRSFDPERRELSGESRLLPERVQVETATWRANFDANQNGLLVYQPIVEGSTGGLQWVDRSGTRIGSLPTEGTTLSLRLSRDDRYLAVQMQVRPTSDIWVYDLSRDNPVKLTFEKSANSRPAWSSDATRVAFQRTDRERESYGVYAKLATGAGRERTILERTAPGTLLPLGLDDWSADDRWLLVTVGAKQNDPDQSSALALVDVLDEQPTARILVHSEAVVSGQFSRDGRWLAYSAVEGGASQVWVVPFEPSEFADSEPLLAGAPRWQVSRAGGSRPRWREDGEELYYVRGDDTIIAVEVDATGSGFDVVRTTELFTAPIRFRDYSYDVTRDGQRFILSMQGSGSATPLVLISDWRAALEER